MGNRIVSWICALCLPAGAWAAAATPASNAELLKLSLLEKPAPRFTLRQDIFRVGAGVPVPAAAGMPPVQTEALQKSIAEEIAQSVTYEGFILKDTKRLVLLNVSGDFFAVGEGDVIVGKIKILKISNEMVTIEYDGQPYEIRIKGDPNG